MSLTTLSREALAKSQCVSICLLCGSKSAVITCSCCFDPLARHTFSTRRFCRQNLGAGQQIPSGSSRSHLGVRPSWQNLQLAPPALLHQARQVNCASTWPGRASFRNVREHTGFSFIPQIKGRTLRKTLRARQRGAAALRLLSRKQNGYTHLQLEVDGGLTGLQRRHGLRQRLQVVAEHDKAGGRAQQGQ